MTEDEDCSENTCKPASVAKMCHALIGRTFTLAWPRFSVCSRKTYLMPPRLSDFAHSQQTQP